MAILPGPGDVYDMPKGIGYTLERLRNTEHDGISPEEKQLHLESSTPLAERIRIPGSGHLAQSEAVTKIINKWLAKSFPTNT